MNKQILMKHIKYFLEDLNSNPAKFKEDLKERLELIEYYQSYTRDKIIRMTEEDIYQYISKLWAMLIWGNKHYVVDKIIQNNGFENVKMKLADLVWSEQDITSRWDTFRKEIKGMGPAMISEILCKTHPDSYMLWNRRAYVSLNYLGVEKLPRYDYQLTGKVYRYLCEITKEISVELMNAGLNDKSLLAVDYFIWDELQVVENLGEIYDKKPALILDDSSIEESKFIHNDTRDKISDIGQWLGFTASIEKKVSEGSQVDAVWEATIGNMGRVIYIFEVQTKGSIDSLILNLLKSINNPEMDPILRTG